MSSSPSPVLSRCRALPHLYKPCSLESRPSCQQRPGTVAKGGWLRLTETTTPLWTLSSHFCFWVFLSKSDWLITFILNYWVVFNSSILASITLILWQFAYSEWQNLHETAPLAACYCRACVLKGSSSWMGSWGKQTRGRNEAAVFPPSEGTRLWPFWEQLLAFTLAVWRFLWRGRSGVKPSVLC